MPSARNDSCADFDEFRQGVDDGADLAAAADLHAGRPQPVNPQHRSAEPVIGRANDAHLEPDANVGQAPAVNHAGRDPAQDTHGDDLKKERQRHHGHDERGPQQSGAYIERRVE